MKKDRHTRVQELLAAARGMSLDEREAFLRRQCGEDSDLWPEVESLLIHDRAASELFGTAALFRNLPFASPDEAQVAPSLERVGPYRILGRLGEGGFGIVYLAEQTEPVRREVALKLLKPGMNSAAVLSRFHAERQALALMEHSGIARMYDVGVSEDARPYFAMECIRGRPITTYAEEQGLSIEGRVELLARVCDAVQHAHQKGIIHRDLKPSNILVAVEGDRPAPKVIDFGVAKAIGFTLTAETAVTQQGQFLGTLEYMSPEQLKAGGETVDTRSDVYALGVVLYELLTGVVPFKSGRPLDFEQWCRNVRECDPPKPSQRVSALEAEGGGETSPACSGPQPKSPPTRARRHARARRFPDELDWITLKALEKDPDRRYPSVGEFAADLRRFLAHEPVTACAPSATYRARKFVRRHRGTVAAGFALLAAITLGTAASLWFGFAATRARQEAERQASTAQAINDFFITDLIQSSDPWSEPSEEPTLREVLLRASQTIDQRHFDDPLVEAALRVTIGSALAGRFENPAAQPHLRKAVEIYRRELGPNHILTLTAMHDLVTPVFESGGRKEAYELSRETMNGLLATVGEDHVKTADAMNNVAFFLRFDREYDQAEALFLRAIAVMRRLRGEGDPETRLTLANYAYLKICRGDLDAESYIRDVYRGTRTALGDEHPATLQTGTFLSISLQINGEFAEAVSIVLRNLAVQERRLGARSPRVCATKTRAAELLEEVGRFAEAEQYLRDAIDIKRDPALRFTPVELPKALERLAAFLEARERFDEAECVRREALEEREQIARGQARRTPEEPAGQPPT